ncbi:hypothetical protein HJFPF1_02802 [Paramyrothecium foliicola]|nr:hypothetical protein HJFPF1_02802 [Paramyrothecium foliicola]
MSGAVVGGYFPVYPHHDNLPDPEIRTFITNFYRTSDNPKQNELWISHFTKDAQVVIGADSGNGEQEIRDLRGRMWTSVAERKHTVSKVFPARFQDPAAAEGPVECECMLFGEVHYTTKDGNSSMKPWAGHGVVRKKDKKNARDSSGIAAAVTKQAAGKISSAGNDNGSSAPSLRSDSVSDASSPPIDTPEIKPTAPDNANPTASPLLEALSTTSVSASTAPSMTNDWPRGAFGGSPGNLIGLISDSPPTQPSSYEDSGRIHPGWAASRNFMSSSPASPSPPSSVRRPLSFQMEPHFHASSLSSQSPPTSNRRSSIQSHARTGSHPPLPHHPQAHFYSAQGLDLTLTPQSGMKAGEQGYFFGFDVLPSSLGESPRAEKVVLAGYEGGLDVYAVNKRGLEPVAGLRGLHGGVFSAKILPWTIDGYPESFSPLIAVVLHGPVIPPALPEVTVQEEGNDAKPNGAASPRAGLLPQEGFPSGQTPAIGSYQTSVHVYSLKTSKLVDTLLQLPEQPINSTIPITNPVFRPPNPSGLLTIKAEKGVVAVCSGVTGECWLYQPLPEARESPRFGCAGKVWTTLQQSYRAEVTEEGEKLHSTITPSRSNPPGPILALGGRWIAYCPAAPSSQISLRAHVPVPVVGRGPGLTTLTPPHLPSVTSSVDLPISDSMVNKMMRETTQELIQGAKWVGQQGLQAWNTYWNKSPSPQSPQQQARSPPQQWPGTRPSHAEAGQFPPTHGKSGQATPKEPGLVSILDTEALLASPSMHPLTTFVTPLGCSFLSFSPSSLALFTASSKGDVQTVWDLFRIQHTRSSPLQATLAPGDSAGPQVRQIAQFSRMTVARIVDVAWAEPQGDRLAMVTERGTIHLLDMPPSSFMWPPPRRRKTVPEKPLEATETPSSAVSIASGALGAAYQAARPFVTRQRRDSANGNAMAGNTLKDSAAHGSRVIAASISSSLGKTGTAISQLRHTGENRVSLPPSTSLPSAACVTWIRAKRSHTLFAVGGGSVRSFPHRLRQSAAQSGKRVGRASKYTDFKIPLLPDDIIAPAVRQIVDLGAAEEYLDLSDRELDAGNTLTLRGRQRNRTPSDGLESSIPQAEIESSAPYQPFHTDRRVALFEYSRSGEGYTGSVSLSFAQMSLEEKGTKKKKKSQPSEATEPGAAPVVSAWAFGQDLPAVKRELGLPSLADQDSSGFDEHRALPPSAMERVMQYGDAEQIVVTTRRRRGARQGDPDEDGFFEDDCEVLDFADQRV